MTDTPGAEVIPAADAGSAVVMLRDITEAIAAVAARLYDLPPGDAS